MNIVGKGVSLIPISDDDTLDIIRWRNHVRENFIYRELFTEESHTKWLNEVVRQGKAVQYVIDTEEDGRIGSVFLRDIDMVNKKAEYGIFIGEETAQGKGYGSEVARIMVKHGLETMGLHKIMLRVFAFNKKAVKCYENAGFQQEGYLKDEVYIDGKFYDIILMGVIRGEDNE